MSSCTTFSVASPCVPRRHFVGFLFTASPNPNRALLQFLTVSDLRLHIPALLHSKRMTNRRSSHDASLPFCRHKDAIRTNKPHPFNEIRIVLDSASRTLSEVVADNCRSMTYQPCGTGLRRPRDYLRSLT